MIGRTYTILKFRSRSSIRAPVPNGISTWKIIIKNLITSVKEYDIIKMINVPLRFQSLSLHKFPIFYFFHYRFRWPFAHSTYGFISNEIIALLAKKQSKEKKPTLFFRFISRSISFLRSLFSPFILLTNDLIMTT